VRRCQCLDTRSVGTIPACSDDDEALNPDFTRHLTDRFSGPGKAIAPRCVCVSVENNFLAKLSLTQIFRSSLCPGSLSRSLSTVTVSGKVIL